MPQTSQPSHPSQLSAPGPSVMLHSRVSALAASEERLARLGPHARMIHAAADPACSIAELVPLVRLPVLTVICGVGALARAGVVALAPTVAPGTGEAERVLSCVGRLRAPGEIAPGASSARIGVAGPGAVAFVDALEGPTQALSPLMPDKRPQEEAEHHDVWFTQLSVDDDAVYVFADASAHTRVGGTWWGQVVRGALGVVVAVDAERVDYVIPAVRDCQQAQIACVLAICQHPEEPLSATSERELSGEFAVPVVGVDITARSSCLRALGVLASSARAAGQATAYASEAAGASPRVEEEVPR